MLKVDHFNNVTYRPLNRLIYSYIHHYLIKKILHKVSLSLQLSVQLNAVSDTTAHLCFSSSRIIHLYSINPTGHQHIATQYTMYYTCISSQLQHKNYTHAVYQFHHYTQLAIQLAVSLTRFQLHIQCCTECHILEVYRYPIILYSRQPIFQSNTDYYKYTIKFTKL